MKTQQKEKYCQMLMIIEHIRQKYCLLNCLANFKHEPVCLMTSMSAVCLQSESIKSFLMVWNVFAKFLVSDARIVWY